MPNKTDAPNPAVAPQSHVRHQWRGVGDPCRYARVVENTDGTVELEHGSALTTAQKRFIADLKDKNREVKVSRRPALK